MLLYLMMRTVIQYFEANADNVTHKFLFDITFEFWHFFRDCSLINRAL